MNERDVLASLARRLLDNHANRTTDSAPAPYRQSTDIYTDQALFDREKQTIFRDNPQFVCFSVDLPEPGSYLTFDDLDVPVLLTRDRDGKVHAFLNACSHRGARMKEGTGKSGTLTCPYHAWSFGLDGRLRGIYEEHTFGAIDKSLYDLIRLPVEEKYGTIWVGMHPDVKFSIDEQLGDLAAYFEMWNFDDMTYVNTHEWRLDTNWKLALDTFCEGYHFGPLHKDTVGDYALSNICAFDTFGPGGRNHRVAFPNTSLLSYRDKPESEWGVELFSHFQLVHFIWPNVSLLVSPTAVEFFQLYPGKRVDQHLTRYRCYWRSKTLLEDQGRGLQDHFEFIREVVDKEDYWVSANVQRSLNAGLKPYNTFGRNEPALINMHRAFSRGAGIEPTEAEPVRAQSLTP